MNKQEVFDKIVTFLHKQGKQCATNMYGCRYRGPNGTMCAVGCLIKDKYYTYDLEGLSVDDSALVVNAVELSLGCALQTEDITFLCKMQKVHDEWFNTSEFPKASFEELSYEYNLQMPNLG